MTRYARFGVTVDCVVFGFDEGELKVLLVERGIPPFEGRWALPGGFVREGESLEEAARRELAEETGLTKVFIEQLYTFGEPARDPRGRIVSVSSFALVRRGAEKLVASADARNAAWFALSETPELAFDHRRILEVAHERLRGKVRWQPLGFELLPAKFTLPKLQHLYEAVLGVSLDKRNFRKKILKTSLLVPLAETEKGVAHRAARLYRFDVKRYEQLRRQGFAFEV